jgi:hypothetical protein
MVPAEGELRNSIKTRIANYEFLIFVMTTVVPDAGAEIMSEEFAVCDVAPPAGTYVIYPPFEIAIGVIIHSVLSVPQADGICTICNDIAVKNSYASAASPDCKLMFGCIMKGAIVIVDGQVGERDIRDARIDVNDCRAPVIAAMIFAPVLPEFGINNSCTISIFSNQGHEASVNEELLVICPLFDQNDDALGIILGNRIERILDCAEAAASIAGDNYLSAFCTNNWDGNQMEGSHYAEKHSVSIERPHCVQPCSDRWRQNGDVGELMNIEFWNWLADLAQRRGKVLGFLLLPVTLSVTEK